MPRDTVPDLTPEQKSKLAAVRAAAAADRRTGIDGPPADADMTDAAPFYFELRAFVTQLKAAREHGLTLADVSARTGIAVETLSRLETGAAKNPTWQTLGKIAVAVGRRVAITAE